MPRIANLAGFDDESTSLLSLVEQAPALWADLNRSGYQVTTPDVLGMSGAEGLCWYIEVGPAQTKAYIWSHRTASYLGNTFLVHGEPVAAVKRARELLESQAVEESFSGSCARSQAPELEHVAAA